MSAAADKRSDICLFLSVYSSNRMMWEFNLSYLTVFSFLINHHLSINLRKTKCAAHKCLWGGIHEINSGIFCPDGSILCLFIHFFRVMSNQIAPVMLFTRGDSSTKKPCVTFDPINHAWGGLKYEVAQPARAGTHGTTSCPIRNTCLRLARWKIVFADMEFAPGNKQSIRVPAATVRTLLLAVRVPDPSFASRPSAPGRARPTPEWR